MYGHNLHKLAFGITVSRISSQQYMFFFLFTIDICYDITAKLSMKKIPTSLSDSSPKWDTEGLKPQSPGRGLETDYRVVTIFKLIKLLYGNIHIGHSLISK
jgi:hypothetical protein